MHCVDSSGWIEFFLGSIAGKTFKPIIDQTDQLIVPSLSFFEVHRFLSRNTDAGQRDECLDIMRRGKVVEVTTQRAIAASDAAQKHRLAMADAMMYSIAREFHATFWTQDVDYKDLPGVSYHAKPA